MTERGTAPLRHWCGGLCLGLLGSLALGGAALADGTREAAASAIAGQAPGATPIVPATALSADPASAAPQDDERRRRMLLLLLMRSTGRFGPYGALGQ